ncbi:MAG: membrane protein insertion efficiency factor YidD [Treponema sp.]|jgi:putative membrane protein insertion efficiency factor|nr:membrane protein insertion efficiency factor YidD [Treponema sp.]
MEIIKQFQKPEFRKKFNFPLKGFLFIIKFYQRAVSPHFPAACRYYPTCSAYTYEAIQKYGILRGLFLAGKRILRCHPFYPGGYDPVP